MTWIQTNTGRSFSFTEPKSADVDIADIAVALSRLVRFLGHTIIRYSVARHCVNAAEIAEEEGLSLDAQRWALLHDAAEAYIGDLPAPLKRLLPDYAAVERQVMAAAAARFGLSAEMPAAVKTIDLRLLATEAAQLMAPEPRPWELNAEPYDRKVLPVWGGFEMEMRADEDLRAFMDRFNKLFPEFAQ